MNVARQFGVDLGPMGTRTGLRSAQSIKAVILHAAEDAYPSPVRAAAVRGALTVNGYAIHQKTVGMTLYRLSLTGHVRREGLDWYFVPQPARKMLGECRQTPEMVRDLASALA